MAHHGWFAGHALVTCAVLRFLLVRPLHHRTLLCSRESNPSRQNKCGGGKNENVLPHVGFPSPRLVDLI
jgi:hypothetical protein